MAKKTPGMKASKKKAAVTKKRSGRRTKPVIAAVLACDSVMQQMPTGKPILVGVFDNVNVPDPSKPFRPFTILTKLFGGKGKFRLNLAVKSPKGKMTELQVAESLDMHPDEIYQGTTLVKDFDVSEEGFHYVYVTLDGQAIGDPCPIQVIHTKKTKGSAQ